MKRSDLAISCAIFGAVLALLVAIDGNQLHLSTLDEGIYLDGAERMLHGERLYSDFFGVMSPGVYWVQEFSFRVLGITMVAGRLPALIYFAAECALLFWLTARLASRAIAWAAVGLFLALQTLDLGFVTAQHRWDSGVIALVSMALAVHALLAGVRWPWAMAGALGVLAAIFTPSMLVIPAVTFMGLIAVRELRGRALPYLAGASAAAAIILVVMTCSGMLWPFLGQMRWLLRNYSAVNRVAYGAPNGGYGAFMAGPMDATLLARVLIALFLLLPAILPVTNLLGWATVLVLRLPVVPKGPRRHAILYFLSCSVALVVSTWPRPSLTHLAFAAPVFFVPAAALLSLAPSRLVREAALILGLFGMALTLGILARSHDAIAISSPVGTVRVPKDYSAESVQALLDKVKPGDSAFVHPYKPLLYFLTQTKNPARYSYLQPGLMTSVEEQSVLADLRRAPPRWVMFRPAADQLLRVFPSTDPARLHFRAIESWIDSEYVPVKPAVEVFGYRLFRLSGTGGTH